VFLSCCFCDVTKSLNLREAIARMISEMNQATPTANSEKLNIVCEHSFSDVCDITTVPQMLNEKRNKMRIKSNHPEFISETTPRVSTVDAVDKLHARVIVPIATSQIPSPLEHCV